MSEMMAAWRHRRAMRHKYLTKNERRMFVCLQVSIGAALVAKVLEMLA